MPRARWSIPADQFAGLYRDGHSLRQIQQTTGLSRDAITDTLRKAGIPIRDRDQSMRLRQRLASDARDQTIQHECALPDCRMLAPQTGIRLCLECSARYEQARQEHRCVWPACEQAAHDGACYAHRKRLDRLFT